MHSLGDTRADVDRKLGLLPPPLIRVERLQKVLQLDRESGSSRFAGLARAAELVGDHETVVIEIPEHIPASITIATL